MTTDEADSHLEREIEQIVGSIRFDQSVPHSVPADLLRLLESPSNVCAE